MKYFLKKVKLLSIVGGTSLLAATGCKLDSNDEPLPAVSYVSIYQASPNAPGLDIILDGKAINGGESFEYTDHTGYMRFFAGTRKLEFGPFGADNVVADTTMKFEDGKAYSVFLADTYEKIDLLVLNDDTTEPGAGKAKVRFLNLSPDTPEIDLQIGDTGTPVISGQSFEDTSDFVEVDAKKYTFQVKTSSGPDVLLTLPNAALLEGWSYTIVVRGYKTPPAGSESVLSAELIVD